jgi:hypothetical protein
MRNIIRVTGICIGVAAICFISIDAKAQQHYCHGLELFTQAIPKEEALYQFYCQRDRLLKTCTAVPDSGGQFACYQLTRDFDLDTRYFMTCNDNASYIQAWGCGNRTYTSQTIKTSGTPNCIKKGDDSNWLTWWCEDDCIDQIIVDNILESWEDDFYNTNPCL